MTDFGTLPLDPYKRTSTTFRPYSTGPSGEATSSVVQRTTPDGRGDRRARSTGAIGLVAAIACIVGVVVNSSVSEPGAPSVDGRSTVEAARAGE